MPRKPKEDHIEPGMKLGLLTVLSQAETTSRGMVRWNCRCDCGNELVLNDKALRFHDVLSCGCQSNGEDLTGRKFGMLTVLGKAGYEANGHMNWLTRCDCGNEKTVVVDVLKAKNHFPYPNCGCTKKWRDPDNTIIVPGMVIGKLTVIEPAGTGIKGNPLWKVRCECGNELLANDRTLRSRTMTTCGCTDQAENIIGQKFGMLTVLSRATNNPNGQARYLCRCDCGNEKIVPRSTLYHKTRLPSCGCYGLKVGAERFTTHGLSKSPIYRIWLGMKARCYNPNTTAYKNYGGRGIFVCDRWKDSFENFHNDMIGTYRPGLQLDRIDNDGPYSPENCHWVTPEKNSRNRRSNVSIDSLVGKKTIAELASITGVPDYLLYRRRKRGVPDEVAIVPKDGAEQILSSDKMQRVFNGAAWLSEAEENEIMKVIEAAEVQAWAIKEFGIGPAEITIGKKEPVREPKPRVLPDDPAAMVTTVIVEEKPDEIKISWQTRD